MEPRWDLSSITPVSVKASFPDRMRTDRRRSGLVIRGVINSKRPYLDGTLMLVFLCFHLETANVTDSGILAPENSDPTSQWSGRSPEIFMLVPSHFAQS